MEPSRPGSPRAIAPKLLALVASAILALALAGCPEPGSNSIASELLKPVTVTLSGKVLDSQSSAAVAGALVKVQRYDPVANAYAYVKAANGTDDLSATAGTDGAFSFAESLSLDVDSYQYFLYISDPTSKYYDNGSMSVYAMRDSALSYPAMRLVSKATTTYTVVSGTVKDILDGTAVAGLTVKLYRKGETVAAFTATTATAGTFSVANVPSSVYSLELDGSGLATAYIKEASDIVLANALTNPLGDLLVSKASTGDDLRIVLAWTDSSLDLDSSFSLPKAGFDFNHLGTRQVKLPSSIISVNSAFKFAEGTAYWPENMGGADDATYRTGVNKARLTHSVSSRTVATLDADSTNGAKPEVTTIFKTSPMSSYPSYLAYYYDFSRAGVNYSYYPIGMGVYNVICSTTGGSIYDSGATVKVYQGSSYLGKFTVADLAIDAGESNRRYWPVLQIEIGFRFPSSTTPTWPVTDSQLYYRVVPYGSAGALPSSRFAGYFYQETSLPGNESFTIWLDQDQYVKDYLFGISSPPYIKKLAGTATGKLYAYDSYDYSKGYAEATSPAVYSWKSHAAVPSDTRSFTMGIYTPLKAQTFYIAKKPTSPTSVDPSLYSGYNYDTALSTYTSAGGAGMTISDAAIVSLGSSHYFTLYATGSGPRGNSTLDGYDTLDLGSFPSSIWDDQTTNTVLTSSTPQALTKALSMRDRYGAIGTYALIGGQGLFVFNTTYFKFTTPAPYSITTKASFSDINKNATNLSSANYIIRAIAQEPVVGASVRFLVATTLSPSLVDKIYSVSMNLSGAVDGVYELSGQPPYAVNDLRYFTKGQKRIALAGTDAGLYVYDDINYAWTPYLQDMLGGFKITKLFDYGGKLGVFAEGNGLMYGPYPE